MSVTQNSPKVAPDGDDFYVQEGCCTSCGVPQVIAPELVGWVDENKGPCYWIRQPKNPEELDRAIKIIHTQELGCHRYSGKDPAVLKRLPREECDFFCPEMALSHRARFGPSDIPLKVSLYASGKTDGILARLWRRVTQRRSSK